MTVEDPGLQVSGHRLRHQLRRASLTVMPAGPLRHTFVTTMLDVGVSLRDVQIAARHADPRTTMRYDRDRKNLDRHPNYILAPDRVSYPGSSVPGMTTVGDRLYFFSGSADAPPGEGVHEWVADAARYSVLAGVRHWRRMLSNFWPADFTLGERTYRTVEHAFQAAKIALVDQVLAERFALESGTELALGDGAAARKHRKLVLLDEVQLRHWDGAKHAVMRDAMRAKFGQHDTLRRVLLATRPAQLWHGAGRGQPPARVHDLEAIREMFTPVT